MNVVFKALSIFGLTIFLSSCTYINSQADGYYKLTATENINQKLLFNFFESLASEYKLNIKGGLIRFPDGDEYINIDIANNDDLKITFLKTPRTSTYYLLYYNENKNNNFHKTALEKLKSNFPNIFSIEEK